MQTGREADEPAAPEQRRLLVAGAETDMEIEVNASVLSKNSKTIKKGQQHPYHE